MYGFTFDICYVFAPGRFPQRRHTFLAEIAFKSLLEDVDELNISVSGNTPRNAWRNFCEHLKQLAWERDYLPGIVKNTLRLKIVSILVQVAGKGQGK